MFGNVLIRGGKDKMNVKYETDVVDFCSNYHQNEEIPSYGPEESLYIFNKLFSVTKNSIFILNGGFTGQISGHPDYYKNLRGCLIRGVKMRILLLGDLVESDVTRLFKRQEFRKQVEIKKCSPEGLEYLKKQFVEDYGTICHFATFDEDKYRLEHSPTEFESVSNFNDTEQNYVLRKIFDNTWKGSVKLD